MLPHRVFTSQLCQTIISLCATILANFNEELNEMIIYLIFCTQDMNFTCCLCSRNRWFGGEAVVISQQYGNLCAGGQAGSLCAGPGQEVQCQPRGRRQPCWASLLHAWAESIGTFTKKSSFTSAAAVFTYPQREGYELLALALEEDFFCCYSMSIIFCHFLSLQLWGKRNLKWCNIFSLFFWSSDGAGGKWQLPGTSHSWLWWLITLG